MRVPFRFEAVYAVEQGMEILGFPVAEREETGILQSNEPDSPRKMQREVERGQAPREVERVDPANERTGEKAHVHFRDGTSLNYDGTIHKKKNGYPKISNNTTKWLGKHNWCGEVID